MLIKKNDLMNMYSATENKFSLQWTATHQSKSRFNSFT